MLHRRLEDLRRIWFESPCALFFLCPANKERQRRAPKSASVVLRRPACYASLLQQIADVKVAWHCRLYHHSRHAVNSFSLSPSCFSSSSSYTEQNKTEQDVRKGVAYPSSPSSLSALSRGGAPSGSTTAARPSTDAATTATSIDKSPTWHTTAARKSNKDKDEAPTASAAAAGIEGGRLWAQERGQPVTREEFRVVVDTCRLPYSLAWREATYEVCLGGGGGSGWGRSMGTAPEKQSKKKRTRVEFWTAFRIALDAARDDCDDILCG